MKNNKKVLIVSSGYLPAKRYGGPVVSLSNLVELCGDSVDFYVFTLNHDLNGKTPFPNINHGSNQIGKAKVFYFSDREFKFSQVRKYVNEIKPDYIYQNSFFDYRSMLISLKISKYKHLPLIVAPRGELTKNALKIKKWKKKPYYNLFKKYVKNKNLVFHSTSIEETNSIHKKLSIPLENIIELENIPSLFSNSFERNYKEKNKINIIFLSRIQTKKNLLYAIRVANKIKNVKITFDIYGPIENLDYWKQCMIEIKKAEKNIKYNYCGEVGREKIFEVFSKYDLFFLPTLSENYGHVIVESLLSSCPILISDQTPWTDINETGGGFAFNLKEETFFEEAIKRVSFMDENEHREIREKSKSYINNKLSIKKLKNNYLELFGSYCSKN